MDTSSTAGSRAALGQLAPRPHPSNGGFSLIEFMTVLCVIGIMLAFAVPSYLTATQANRIAAEVNGFAGDLQFARSEAIKQGLTVSLCASSDGQSCANTTAWQGGWILFTDPNANQTVDTGELIIRRQPAWSGTDTFTASGNVTAVSYNRDGFAVGLPGTVTLTLHTTPSNPSATQCLQMNFIGHDKVITPNGSDCT